VETYRLSVDVARAVEMLRRENARKAFENEDSQRRFAPDDSTANMSSSAGAISANGASSSAPSSPRFNRSTRTFVLYDIDPANDKAYGDGCVTQVKCGGQLVIRIKQTNHAKQIKAWGASMDVGFSMSGGSLSGGRKREREGGDQKLNVDIRHAGGPALPKQFHNCTIQDIEVIVQDWADQLAQDAMLAIPLRVGVHRYDALESLLLTSPGPTTSNNGGSGSAFLPPPVRSLSGMNPRAPAGPIFTSVVEPCAQCVTLSTEVDRLRAELEEYKQRVQTLTADADPNKSSPDLAATVAPPALGERSNSSATIAALPSSESDANAVVLASLIVPRIKTSSAATGSDTISFANRVALAHYVSKACNGDVVEVDFSQLPSGPEAVLWSVACLSRCPDVVRTVRLTNLRIADREAPLLAQMLQAFALPVNAVRPLGVVPPGPFGEPHTPRTAGSATPLAVTVAPVLEWLDLSDNHLTAVGAITLVEAALYRHRFGAGAVSLYLDNNRIPSWAVDLEDDVQWRQRVLTEHGPMFERLRALLRQAGEADITVSF
jgi:hypothetical protein